MSADRHVRTPEDVPEQEHFAIFESRTITIPGDERSRTNPGHGYPESTESFISYEAYFTKEKLLAAIKKLEDYSYSKKAYRVVKVTPMSVNVSLSVDVK